MPAGPAAACPWPQGPLPPPPALPDSNNTARLRPCGPPRTRPRARRRVLLRPERSRRAHFRGTNEMSVDSERIKKRYAEDEKFRKRVLAKNRAWRRKNRKEVNARRRLKRLTDPEYRERQVA